jgi:di/tricarboxylate transporter
LDEIGIMEAVVTDASPLVNRSPARVRLYERHNVNLLAVSRHGEPIMQRLRSVRLQAGDVVAFQGNLSVMPETLGDLGCLPLAGRNLQLGHGRRRWVTVALLAAAIVVLALNLVPVQIAFFTLAAAVVLIRSISLKEAYDAIDWPILVMLAALIPVSDAVRTTGGADLIASGLASAAHALPPAGALALILIVAMAVTPFLNNAATVLIMAPIAARFAQGLGFNADPFLMAVAIGAACDFLTPIGHQCNTLVMGPGGYRFGDYWRLGLPLSILVVVVSVCLIPVVWPLRVG